MVAEDTGCVLLLLGGARGGGREGRPGGRCEKGFSSQGFRLGTISPLSLSACVSAVSPRTRQALGGL